MNFRSIARGLQAIYDAADLIISQNSSPSDVCIINNVSSPGSVGDAYMLAGALAGLGEGLDVGIAAWSRRDAWEVQNDRSLSAALRLSPYFQLPTRTLNRATKGCRSLLLLAADSLDGTYGHRRIEGALRLLIQGSRLGLDCRAVSFSVSKAPVPSTVRAVRGALSAGVTFAPRGPVSAARLGDLTGRRFGWYPDLGWIAAVELARAVPQVSTGGTVGVGFGRQFLRQEKNSLEILARVIQDLLSHGYEVIMLPHDDRGPDNDRALLNRLAKMSGGRECSEASTVTAVDLAGALSHCDVVISARMHLTIASLARGVPVLPLTYADKFEDLHVLGLGAMIGHVDLSKSRIEDIVSEVERLGATPEAERQSCRATAVGVAEHSLGHVQGLSGGA